MKTSHKLVGGVMLAAVAFVGGKEGVRLHAYRDSGGIPTGCYGETRGVHMDDKWTLAQCKAMFGPALADFATHIDACLKDEDHIPTNTYVAFLSAAYNAGWSGFCNSAIVTAANRGDLKTACEYLRGWRATVHGRPNRGLQNRRRDETALCLSGLKA